MIDPRDTSNWGWQKDKNGRYHTLCNKKDGDFNCSGRCSWVKVRQTCTELCKYKAACLHSLEFKDSDNNNEQFVADDEDSTTEEAESDNGEDYFYDEIMEFDAQIDILFDDDF